MRYILPFILFAIITCNVNAQDTVVVRNNITIMFNAMVKNDMSTLADLTHPKIIASLGGREKAIVTMNAAIAEMKSKGMSFRNASIGKIGEFYKSGSEVFCLIPQEITLTTEGGYFSSLTSTLGISQDQGRTWRFVSAGNIGRDKLKILFPELPDGLEVLLQTDPVFHKQ
ncbi:hypothetical protein [Pedobacter caeni]|uniref:Uncharacterized protein n=1 Tax=Pedobacter caeni TaxID=288992 RepID=A0A1M4TSH6_9SPHI|nr:hypothetical protein [Pedobacter caeni]SHE47257.1 hypothetical protein SAMN04488522_101297 [Pedobacter caeni]